MKSVNISDLKNRLSHYLRLVRCGERIQVCDHGKVIARIEPVADLPHKDDEAWLADLERTGVIRRGTGRLTSQWFDQRPKVRVDVVAAILKERGGD